MNRLISIAVLTAGCAGGGAPVANEATLSPVLGRAEAVLMDSAGRQVGVATFVERDEGVSIGVSVTGLPAGTHGFHIHERGACEAPTFESASGRSRPGRHGPP